MSTPLTPTPSSSLIVLRLTSTLDLQDWRLGRFRDMDTSGSRPAREDRRTGYPDQKPPSRVPRTETSSTENPSRNFFSPPPGSEDSYLGPLGSYG